MILSTECPAATAMAKSAASPQAGGHALSGAMTCRRTTTRFPARAASALARSTTIQRTRLRSGCDDLALHLRQHPCDGLDCGVWLPGQAPRKQAAKKSPDEMADIRARAWATRRRNYGER